MVVIDQEKCIGCGLCAGDCTYENILIKDGKARCRFSCMQCGHCVAICPTGAVSIPDYEMSDVEEFDKNRFGLDYDQLMYTIKARRSIRHYEERAVEREKLEKIIQAGRYTATGVNRQDCRFIIIQEGLPELKQMIWAGIDRMIENPDGTEDRRRLIQIKNIAGKRSRGIDFLFRNAPVVLYIAADSPHDASLAAQNMELAAISLGLGVLYNGYLTGAANTNQEAREWLGLEDKDAQICLLVGYPDVNYRRTAPRKKADVVWK